MKKIVFAVLMLSALGTSSAVSAAPQQSRGYELYKKHCAACHPHAERIRHDVNITAFMREPVPPMPSFRNDKISDADAQSIAAFIKVRIYGARMSTPAP